MNRVDAEKLDRSMFATKTAFIVGYTGEIGKQLTKELLQQKVFGRLILVGRRKVDFGDDPLYRKNVEQIQIDFDAVEKHKTAFSGVNVGFCCLGTTRAKSGRDGFIKVYHDYVLNVAQVAKECGCEQFHLVSSKGADKNSTFLYPQTKGKVEEDVAALGFQRFSIYRPAFLIGNRQETRIGERVALFVLRPVSYMFPTFITIPIETVARAMIANLWNKPGTAVEILENSAVHHLGGEVFKEQFG